MSYEVVLLRTAGKDLTEIVDWIAARSNEGAQRWLEAFQRTVGFLEENPERFAVAPENDTFSVTLRQALFKTRRGKFYRVLFTIAGSEVRVLHIRGPGQQLIDTDDS